MQNVGERAGACHAATVLGAAVVLLVVATVLLVPHEGWGVCFGSEAGNGGLDLGRYIGFGAPLGNCSMAWISPVGIPTGYVLWGGVQVVIIAAAVAVQALLLDRSGKRAS